MSTEIEIRVDPSNPGEFFACCGLFELAHRLWDQTEASFTRNLRVFRLTAASGANASELFEALAESAINNTMTADELRRTEDLSRLSSREIKATASLEAEKKRLDKLRREAPLVLTGPWQLRLDWFLDDYAGGSHFKTWAGQQSVLDLARELQGALRSDDARRTPVDDWLRLAATDGVMPFNFDAALGGSGSAQDVGFAFDPLKDIRVRLRPLLELAAFVGLQRFRPEPLSGKRFRYCAWTVPLPIELAAPVVAGAVSTPGAQPFEFRLLYRTKYLKSFLPAQPVTVRGEA